MTDLHTQNAQLQLLLLELEIAREFPDFRVVSKPDSRLMRLIHVALCIISFGRMRRFMSDFITTVGNTVYVPAGWDNEHPTSRLIVLRHERVHMCQRARYGSFLFSVLYLFCPVPFVLAYCRARFEKEAYEETMTAIADLRGVGQLREKHVRDAIVQHFTSADYLWMWPFRRSIEDWYDGVVAELAEQ